MTQQEIIDIATHATNRIDNVFNDGLSLLDTHEECMAFMTLVTEYTLRTSAMTMTRDLASCADFNVHERVVVISSLISKMVASALDESTPLPTPEYMLKVESAMRELGLQLIHLLPTRA
jgi:hypothetical protein